MVLVGLLAVKCLFKDPLDGEGAGPVASLLAASTVLPFSTLLVSVVEVVFLFDVVLVHRKKSPTAGPGF